ncbi:hypothetical protein EIP91_003127 [Steccherinum ochraceum]|uniref:HNH nuclease domain-containing protein n=1 Tax=Steccherinum ochraceum TaxID=92696 RepID=A0A4R0S484_9APHY|nr:hypothetical protein EIP91_003127 [Steccherinum ochraceum]
MHPHPVNNSSMTTHTLAHSAQFRSAVVKVIEDREITTHSLSHDAYSLVDAYALQGIPPCQFAGIAKPIDVMKVLRAMLEASKICGSTRYVAAAIILMCRGKNGTNENTQDGEDEARIKKNLTALARIWAVSLLWPFYINGYLYSSLESSSGESSPMLGGIEDGKSNSLRDEVLARHGFRCIVTGFRDYGAVNKLDGGCGKPDKYSDLAAVHILHRSVLHAEDVPTAIPPVAADVFEYFAHLPTESVDELLATIDTAENVFMVHPEWYTRFHRLDWCFVPIGMDFDNLDDVAEHDSRPQRYKVEWLSKHFHRPGAEAQAVSDEVAFEDHDSSASTPEVPSPK